MCWSLFYKVTGLQAPAQVFSSKYCKIFKNTHFEEHLRTGASVTFLSWINESVSMRFEDVF